jgi:hypothetical protein
MGRGGAFASDLYGGPAMRQPTPTSTPDHMGSPEPFARTLPTSSLGALGNPTFVLIALMALAALLINFSVRFEVTG